MSQSVSELLTHFRSQYLENVGVGVRRFSDLSGIRRSRLKKLFEGKATATELEIAQISLAMEQIEATQKRNELPSFPPRGRDTNAVFIDTVGFTNAVTPSTPEVSIDELIELNRNWSYPDCS